MSGKHRLFMDEITSVGFVDAGANDEANVVFWKKRTNEDTEPSTIQETGSAASAEPLQKEAPMPEFDLSALGDDAAKVQEHIAALEAQVADLTPPPAPEDVAKAASPEVQAIIKAQEDRIAKLEADRAADAERLEAEIAKSRSVDFAKRAEKFTGLLGKPSDVGPVLDSLEKAAPDAYAKLEAMLGKAAELEGMAELFKERGHSGDGPVSYADAKAAHIAKARENGSDKSDAELAAEFARSDQAKALTVEERT